MTAARCGSILPTWPYGTWRLQWLTVRLGRFNLIPPVGFLLVSLKLIYSIISIVNLGLIVCVSAISCRAGRLVRLRPKMTSVYSFDAPMNFNNTNIYKWRGFHGFSRPWHPWFPMSNLLTTPRLRSISAVNWNDTPLKHLKTLKSK